MELLLILHVSTAPDFNVDAAQFGREALSLPTHPPGRTRQRSRPTPYRRTTLEGMRGSPNEHKRHGVITETPPAESASAMGGGGGASVTR